MMTKIGQMLAEFGGRRVTNTQAMFGGGGVVRVVLEHVCGAHRETATAHICCLVVVGHFVAAPPPDRSIGFDILGLSQGHLVEAIDPLAFQNRHTFGPNSFECDRPRPRGNSTRNWPNVGVVGRSWPDLSKTRPATQIPRIWMAPVPKRKEQHDTRNRCGQAAMNASTTQPLRMAMAKMASGTRLRSMSVPETLYLAEVGPHLVGIGANLAAFGPSLMEFGRRPANRGRMWAESGRIWPGLVEIGPNVGRNLAKFGRCLEIMVKFQHNFGGRRAKFGRSRADVGRCRSRLSRSWAQLARIQPRSFGLGSSSAEGGSDSPPQYVFDDPFRG